MGLLGFNCEVVEELDIFSYQLSVISYQLSVISYQLSVISYQLSVISYQLSVISYQSVPSYHETAFIYSPYFPTTYSLTVYCLLFTVY
ncbi:MAG: hypothetical protein EWV90_05340 [Microcystis aeruginosa Ma_QC_Ch_20071001_M135]|nr:MAG: hypothetical protein EWV90_05340 [Microcystis aeruginosa Ma_QC_Ch_20071001_M135]